MSHPWYTHNDYKKGGTRMKGLRILFSFAVLLLIMPIITTNAATFSDVKHYEEEIDYLVGEKILNGYLDGTFKPQRNINRLNGIQILLRAKGITDFDAPDPNFTDMKPGTHGYQEVAKAVELGIISGKKNADGTRYFDAKAPLTRGQMAKILVETMELPIDRGFKFRDVQSTNGYYPYVSTLAAERITEGYPDRTFRPNQPISRQHFSVFVARLLNNQFKPTVNKSSYASNRELVYTFRDNYGKHTHSKFLRTERIGSILSEVWQYSGSALGQTMVFYEWEDRNGLHWADALGSEYMTSLDYPLYLGKSFPNYYGNLSGEVVSAMGLTVTTEAGTFYHVTEVSNADGYKVYYAPGYGSIKTVYSGRTINELVHLRMR